MKPSEKIALARFLSFPRSLEDASAFLGTEWRTTYRRLREFHAESTIVSVFFGGRACFVLESRSKQFDKKGKPWQDSSKTGRKPK